MRPSNTVIVRGRIAREIALEQTSGGTPACQLTVAVNRPLAAGRRPRRRTSSPAAPTGGRRSLFPNISPRATPSPSPASSGWTSGPTSPAGSAPGPTSSWSRRSLPAGPGAPATVPPRPRTERRHGGPGTRQSPSRTMTTCPSDDPVPGQTGRHGVELLPGEELLRVPPGCSI